MENTPNRQDGAAVSRSGRVLKKSSKLMDFQSPEDLDGRYKRTSSSHKPPRHYRPDALDIPMGTFVPSDDPDVDVPEGGGKDMMDVERQYDGPENYQDSAPSKSIYMTEKSTKKKVMKDGRLVLTKAQRKDKGKSRYTAYMLWAKDVRQELLYSHPALDFATISRRLGEMWANVPSNVKFNWRRKAKRLAAKGAKPDKSVLAYKRANSKFLNKNSPAVSKGATATKTLIKAPHRDSDVDTKGTPILVKSITSSHVYRVNTSHPLDVAAHLKLLGDNLTIIGQRLKEHEGQIAVSGSLSVLLDSLLCSLGPLMCLTVHIPGIGNHLDDLKLTLHNTLDNIAYVMPGL
uniref:Putative hmg box-containing protein 4 n=1 Tax=Nyssomyia neivai TaxID=330878 RepID=A0A1L8DCD7_9DIPT